MYVCMYVCMYVYIVRYPRALTYSSGSNLGPKLAYLRQELHFSQQELSEEVFEYPLLLGYSLQKRIMPRHAHLMLCDIDVRPRASIRLQGTQRRDKPNKKKNAARAGMLEEHQAALQEYQAEPAGASGRGTRTLGEIVLPSQGRKNEGGKERKKKGDSRRVIGLRSMLTPGMLHTIQ